MKIKNFRKNEDFFKWIKENKDKITKVVITTSDNLISVKYELL